MSPSSRRAWIEILMDSENSAFYIVALLAEGVDRNASMRCAVRASRMVALLAEGVDRNIKPLMKLDPQRTSPSSRRAWIEIASIDF